MANPTTETPPAPTRVTARKAAGATRVLNCLPSPKQEDDWDVATAREAGVMAAAAPLPTSVDLREDWWRIGDQGSTGSCVGWASADSVLRWHFVKAGRLGTTEKLSVRFQWMAAKETDQFMTRPTTFIEREGTSLKAALDVSRKLGAVADRELPFVSGRLYRGEAKAFYLLASKLRIGAYVNLGSKLVDWRRWLANEGPILTRLDCDDTWMDAKATKGLLAEYHPDTADGGHAVAMVGYDQDSFIIRNSWGTTQWGDKGFGFASTAYAQAAFTEAYGVTL
jgi:hypothetical protein